MRVVPLAVLVLASLSTLAHADPWRLAVGGGWTLPGDLSTSTAGAGLRLRTPGGLVIQPRAFVGVSRSNFAGPDWMDGAGDYTSSSLDLQTAFELSLGRRGPVELFVGPTVGANMSWFSAGEAGSATQQSFTLGWRIEAELWLRDWFSMTAGVGSSLFSMDRAAFGENTSTNIGASLSVASGVGQLFANLYF